MKAKILLLGLAVICSVTAIRAQYCTPTVTSTGVYLYNVYFNGTGTSGITSGVAWTGTGSQGYANNSASSSGTVSRYCSISMYYHVFSCGNRGNIPYNVRIFADYNGDFDFDDAGEIVYDYDYTAPNGDCASVGTGASFQLAPNAPSSVRLRWAVREGGAKATPCGGYVGEIEDYTLTLAANVAPAMNAAAVPFANAIKESQTNNDGFSIQQLLNSAPGQTMFSDGNTCTPMGVAITAVTGSGQWQYKTGSGAWTNIGSVSSTSALLLNGQDNSTPGYRLRFVPSGAGTATISFKGWDGTVGSAGSAGNVSVTGGSTAYTNGTKTLSLTIYSNASTSADVSAYMATAAASAGSYNVKAASLNRTTGDFKNPESITTDNVNGYSYDIDIDNVSNKLIWAGGSDGTRLMRSNLDGSSVQTIATGLGYPTGVAVGDNKIFVADYGTAIYSYNLDGSNPTAITGNAGQANDISITSDIEYSNNKIYYVNSPDAIDFNIVQANADGTASTILYTTNTNVINGLSVTGTTIYWTEMDGSGNAMVKSKLITGGAASTLVTEANMFYTDVFADESNSKIYMNVADAGTFANSRIKSIPLAGGAATRLLDLEDVPGAIVFRSVLGTLPVHFIDVKAFKVNDDVKVEWNIAQEENVLKYVVERSGDGRQFSDVGFVLANNQTNYSWLDQQPLAGKNYYRIRAVDIDGKLTYSSIVVVDMSKDETRITIYPTVTENRQFNLRLESAPSGTYTLTAINAAGQHVYTKTIIHSGGSSVQDIRLPGTTPAGVYKIRVMGKEKSWVETIIVK